MGGEKELGAMICVSWYRWSTALVLSVVPEPFPALRQVLNKSCLCTPAHTVDRMERSVSTIDGWIEKLMSCKHLTEQEVTELCEKVREH